MLLPLAKIRPRALAVAALQTLALVLKEVPVTVRALIDGDVIDPSWTVGYVAARRVVDVIQALGLLVTPGIHWPPAGREASLGRAVSVQGAEVILAHD